MEKIRLFLNNNQLTDSSFDVDTFTNSTLQEIEFHLESNSIVNVNEEVFKPLLKKSNETKIYLNNNPINCLQAKWLKTEAQNNEMIQGINCNEY